MRSLLTVIAICALCSFAYAGKQELGYKQVAINSAEFKPKIGDSLKMYRGRSIAVQEFRNRAENTTRYEYKSEFADISYYNEDELLHDIFEMTFRKMVRRMGMAVYDADDVDVKVAFIRVKKKRSEDLPSGTPEVEFTLRSITDSRFKVDLEFTVDGVPELKKSFSVSADKPTQDVLEDRRKMEARAYDMINQLYEKIFTDEEVVELFKQSPIDKAKLQQEEEKEKDAKASETESKPEAPSEESKE